MHNTDGAGTAPKVTVVEDGTEFRGSMYSSCAVLVRGRVAGDVSSPALSVTSTGMVSGRVKVTTLTSEGEIAGEIDAETVTLAGRVSDGTVIRAKSLEARLSNEGGMTVSFGDARLEVGDEPVTPTTTPARSSA